MILGALLFKCSGLAASNGPRMAVSTNAAPGYNGELEQKFYATTQENAAATNPGPRGLKLDVVIDMAFTNLSEQAEIRVFPDYREQYVEARIRTSGSEAPEAMRVLAEDEWDTQSWTYLVHVSNDDQRKAVLNMPYASDHAFVMTQFPASALPDL